MKYFYFILGLPVNILLGILSFVIPKKDIFIFSSKDKNYMSGNSKLMFDYYLENHDSKKIYWVSKSKKIQIENHYINNILYLYSLKTFILLLKAKILFIDDEIIDISYSPVLFGKFNIVQLWHGTGFKKIGIEAVKDGKGKNSKLLIQKITEIVYGFNLKKYKLIVASSEKDKLRKQKSFNSKNVAVVGSPRNDVFFDESLRKYNYKKQFNFENYESVILYAPTFRDNKNATHFNKKFFDKLNIFLEEKNYLLVIKKHPSDYDFKIPKSFSNIKDISSEVKDVQELLIDVDILISDYSGIVTDFALLNKPIIFYVYDFEQYIENCRGFNYDLKKTLPGPFIYEEIGIINYLNSLSWFDEKEYQNKYKKFQKEFHEFGDDKSRERTLTYINKELGIK